MRRFYNDWIDRACMRTFWLVANRDPSSLSIMLQNCASVLMRLDSLHAQTRQLFAKLSTQESLVFRAMRKGKKFFRLSGRLLSLREALAELYRRRRALHDRLADIQRRQDSLIKHSEEIHEVLSACA